MGIIARLSFGMNPSGFVLDLLKKWRPRACATEKDYETSLCRSLQPTLEEEGIELTKQYASGRIKGDMVIGRNVLIELKTNLDSTSKLQRLLGQLGALFEGVEERRHHRALWGAR